MEWIVIQSGPAEHTCRDEGHDPYDKVCPACLSQLCKNSAELARRTKRTGHRYVPTPAGVDRARLAAGE